MPIKQKKRRLFFAFWPSPQIRQSIVEAAEPLLQTMDARVITAENFHITLHFIGSASDEAKDCLHRSAQSIDCKPFDISLDRFGFFSRAGIFWMAAQAVPVELNCLHKNLGEALVACDFIADQRPYSPHVSLLRKVRKNMIAKTALENQRFLIDWHVDAFVLVESVSSADGLHYEVLESYPLTGN